MTLLIALLLLHQTDLMNIPTVMATFVIWGLHLMWGCESK